MSERARQLLGILIGIPLCLAVGASIVIFVYNLGGAARIWAIAALLTIAVAVLVLYAVRNAKGNKLVEQLLDILYKEVNPDKFIAESKKVLDKTRNRALRNTLLLNLAVGYEAVGQFDEAIDVMKSMLIGAADKVSKAMFYCNAAAFYAEKGAVAEGHEAYTLGQPFFEKAGENIPVGYLRLSRGLLYYADGKYEEALEAFSKARGRGFEDRHTMTKLQLFEARALARLGRIKEAKSVYSKIVQKKTYPYLLECAKQELQILDAKTE